jgi:hypothetical protein
MLHLTLFVTLFNIYHDPIYQATAIRKFCRVVPPQLGTFAFVSTLRKSDLAHHPARHEVYSLVEKSFLHPMLLD